LSGLDQISTEAYLQNYKSITTELQITKLETIYKRFKKNANLDGLIHIHQTLFSSKLKNELKKQECYITLGCPGLPLKTLWLIGPVLKLKKKKLCDL
jgi:hypothetical protein